MWKLILVHEFVMLVMLLAINGVIRDSLICVILPFILLQPIIIFCAYRYYKKDNKEKRHIEKNMEQVAQVWDSTLGDEYPNMTVFNCPLRYITLLSYDKDKDQYDIHFLSHVNPYIKNVPNEFFNQLNFLNGLSPKVNAVGVPNKMGFMDVKIGIDRCDANREIMVQLRKAVESIAENPGESGVCFKAEYDGGMCYFEDSWMSPNRAIMKGEQGYERYDFSDSSTFDYDEMWEFIDLEYHRLTYSETFELIEPQEFQRLWDATPLIHKVEEEDDSHDL